MRDALRRPLTLMSLFIHLAPHSGLVPGYTKIPKLKFDQPKSSFNMLVKHLVKWFLNIFGFWPFLDFLKIGGFA